MASDHRLISYRLTTKPVPAIDNPGLEDFPYRLTGFDPDRILDEAQRLTTLLERVPWIPGIISVDSSIHMIIEGIQQIQERCFGGKRIFIGRPRWWNSEIKAPRKASRVTRRLYQRCRSLQNRPVLRERYLSALINYRLAIEDDKRKLWKSFVHDDLSRNPWGITYKLAARKLAINTVLSTVATAEEPPTIRGTHYRILDTLIPDNDPALEDENLRLCLILAEAPPTSAKLQVEVVEQDVVAAVHFLRDNKSTSRY